MEKKKTTTTGIVAALIVIVGVAIALFAGGGFANFTPDDVTVPRAALGFGEYATLGIGESAEFVGEVEVVITDFVYGPCPEGMACVWSGLAVIHEVRVGNQRYESDGTGHLSLDTPYEVVISDTDYQTYATLTVTPRRQY